MPDILYADGEDVEDGFEVVHWWDDFNFTAKTPEAKRKQVEEFNARLERLYDYCIVDVESERAAEPFLYPLSTYEREVYLLDQKINDRGIKVDIPTTKAALDLSDRAKEYINNRLAKLTGNFITTSSQVEKIRKWCALKGYEISSLDKQTISKALESDLLNEVREILELRQAGSKSSVRKLQAILNMAEEDDRIRGNILYHGATTGRFAGKGVQLHNLPRPSLSNPESAIPYLLKGDLDEIEVCFGPVQNVISDCIRSLIIADDGKLFCAADFSAIEARVLAWVAGQTNLTNQFKNDEDIYCYFASIIYQRPINKKDHPKERQLGKGAVLGLGFGMGPPKFKATCAKDKIFLPDEEFVRVVQLYRKTFKKITSFWYDLERAAIRAVKNPSKIILYKNLKLRMRDGNLRLMLPSGRVLNYPKATVEKALTPWGEIKEAVEISAVNPVTRKWERATVSPGTFTENVVQAIARDLMVAAMFRAEATNYPVVLTVHDEVVSEVDEGYGSVREYEALLSAVPEWAAGLPVKAEGWMGKRYRK